MLAIALHLRAPGGESRGLRSPRPGRRPAERERSGAAEPEVQAAEDPAGAHPEGSPLEHWGLRKGRGTRPNHLSHRFPPAGVSRPQLKLYGFLTSDSRRWLLNASRPLGAACFPLPPPLPLLLADELPAPGATGSSMRPLSASPLSLSALSARGDPAAARREPGPAPSTAIGRGRAPQPRPAAQLVVRRLQAGLGRGGGAHSRDFAPLLFFFFKSCGVAGSFRLRGRVPAPPPEFWALSSVRLSFCFSFSTHRLPNSDLFGEI